MNYGPNDKQDCWFGGTANWVSQKTTISRVPNEDLSWAKIYQVDAGLDFDFLNMFSFNTNFFYRKIDGIIANTTSVTPGVFGLSGMSMFEKLTAISIRGVDATLILPGHWVTSQCPLVSAPDLHPEERQGGRGQLSL